MLKKILIGVVSLVILIAFMLAFAPAKTLINYAKNQFPQQLNAINFTGVSGSIWNTHVQRITVKDFSLDNLKLKTSVLNLVSGRLKTTISIQDPNLQLQGVVKADQQTLEANDLNVTLNPKMLDPMMQFPIVGLSGTMQASLKKAVIKNNWPENLDGTVNWKGSLIRYLDRETELGDFRLKLFSQNGELHLNIIENNGPLDIQGFIKILPNKTYYLDISTVQQSASHDEILTFIKRFAKPENGRYQIRWQGPLSGVM